jgi:aspartokinase-like uncharacterized kinase
MWVIKIGGSLADSSQLPRWLATIAEAGAGQAVIVPGGGAFADQVRSAQRRWGFPDSTAHQMALLGMNQFGTMMRGLEPLLVAADSTRLVLKHLSEERVPVWLPWSMPSSLASLPDSWSFTSDSLSAWLAGELGASDLALVKSVNPAPGQFDASILGERQIVDECLVDFVEASGFRCWWLGNTDQATMKSALLGESPVMTQIVRTG